MDSTNPPRIYVFDFDQTITNIHTGGCAFTEEEVAETYIRSNLKDGLVELVEYLVQKKCHIYIATYGDDRYMRGIGGVLAGHALVKRYMDVAFGADQRHFTFAEELTGTIIARNSADGKRYHLERILEREGLDGNDLDVMRSIMLIDDDPYNVHYFAQRGCATLVPESPHESARRAADADILRALLDDLSGTAGPESEKPNDSNHG